MCGGDVTQRSAVFGADEVEKVLRSGLIETCTNYTWPQHRQMSGGVTSEKVLAFVKLMLEE